MARMFVRDADLYILDEPTASLDPQAESDFYNNFLNLITQKTSILITHRFSTTRMANMIAVIKDGRIQEFGFHEVLMKLMVYILNCIKYELSNTMNNCKSNPPAVAMINT